MDKKRIEFTAHNIRLDNGTFTRPETGISVEAYSIFVSAKKILDTVFPGDKSRFRLVDLGCLEGGYSVEFARIGFQVLGLDVRDSNFAACCYVKENTNLPNLKFVKDNAWNVATYGSFDVTFCCGLLYHLDKPKRFLEILSQVTTQVLILQTHFSITKDTTIERLLRILRQMMSPFPTKISALSGKYTLSSITENESLRGRWYTEFVSDAEFYNRKNAKWASWDNRRSFWIQREFLIQAIHDVGFDIVMEQYDHLGPNIANAMTFGYYKTDKRGTFIGIKSNK